jgi:hypothetical protein
MDKLKIREVKSTAIVGSAAYMTGMGFGPEIDSHDYVVRVSSGFTMCKAAPDDFGTRTTHLYINQWTRDRLKELEYPEGVRIRLKRHVVKETRAEDYESNTGTMCVVDYAINGHKIKVYGFDFYSAPFGGMIPEGYTIRDAPDVEVVDRSQVYPDGYCNGLINSDKFRMAHVGGLRDFRIFVTYMDRYGIQVDPHMAEIIEKNRHRI